MQCKTVYFISYLRRTQYYKLPHIYQLPDNLYSVVMKLDIFVSSELMEFRSLKHDAKESEALFEKQPFHIIIHIIFTIL